MWHWALSSLLVWGGRGSGGDRYVEEGTGWKARKGGKEGRQGGFERKRMGKAEGRMGKLINNGLGLAGDIWPSLYATGFCGLSASCNTSVLYIHAVADYALLAFMFAFLR